MTDIKVAKDDPSSVYRHPHEVVEDDTISREEKIAILKSWEYDEREIAVAEEENMQSKDNRHAIILDEVLRSLIELGVDKDGRYDDAPTKQG